jgi:hypothetical protein
MRDAPRGYGNIYTPHAGSMIIQVERESGLASRTIVLSTRQVRLLRICTSRAGRIAIAVLLAIFTGIAIEAARVPTLTRELATFEHTATRLDTLQRSLAALQARYDQVQRMLGATPARPGEELTPVEDSIRRPRRGRTIATESGASVAPSTAPVAPPIGPDSSTAPARSAAPMD